MTFWTEERVERLENLWERGYSASLIAEMIGTSRSAVAGKAWRLQLPEREVLYAKARPRRRGKGFTLRRSRAPRMRPPPKPRHNGDFSWHFAQVAAGVAVRADHPPKPPEGYPSWRTFRRYLARDAEAAARVRSGRTATKQAA